MSYAKTLVEDYLNRELYPQEKIVFLDRNSANVLIENLAVQTQDKLIKISDIRQLKQYHRPPTYKKYQPTHLPCVYCKKDFLASPTQVARHKSGEAVICSGCKAAYKVEYERKQRLLRGHKPRRKS